MKGKQQERKGKEMKMPNKTDYFPLSFDGQDGSMSFIHLAICMSPLQLVFTTWRITVSMRC
jgi:hypothetical protein